MWCSCIANSFFGVVRFKWFSIPRCCLISNNLIESGPDGAVGIGGSNLRCIFTGNQIYDFDDGGDKGIYFQNTIAKHEMERFHLIEM